MLHAVPATNSSQETSGFGVSERRLTRGWPGSVSPDVSLFLQVSLFLHLLQSGWIRDFGGTRTAREQSGTEDAAAERALGAARPRRGPPGGMESRGLPCWALRGPSNRWPIATVCSMLRNSPAASESWGDASLAKDQRRVKSNRDGLFRKRVV